MLHVALALFLIALIAALLGFTGVAAGVSGIAKVLFVLLLIAAAAVVVIDELIKAAARRSPPTAG